MILADEIEALRDRTLADLTLAHDYYVDAKIAWHLVREMIKEGQTFQLRNRVTGTSGTQATLAAKSRGYVTKQLAEATFPLRSAVGARTWDLLFP